MHRASPQPPPTVQQESGDSGRASLGEAADKDLLALAMQRSHLLVDQLCDGLHGGPHVLLIMQRENLVEGHLGRPMQRHYVVPAGQQFAVIAGHGSNGRRGQNHAARGGDQGQRFAHEKLLVIKGILCPPMEPYQRTFMLLIRVQFYDFRLKVFLGCVPDQP